MPARTHGMYQTPTYFTWVAMKSRCYCESHVAFPNYGARGISVCPQWINSFETFLSDMGERPSKNHSLDRIDVNGNYEPSNCRWATRTIQSNNRRNTRSLKIGGTLVSAREFYLSHPSVVGYTTFASRLRAGWSAQQALIVPIIKPNGIRVRDASVTEGITL